MAVPPEGTSKKVKDFRGHGRNLLNSESFMNDCGRKVLRINNNRKILLIELAAGIRNSRGRNQLIPKGNFFLKIRVGPYFPHPSR